MSELVEPGVAAARYVLGVATEHDVAALVREAGGAGAALESLDVPLPSAEDAGWTLLEVHIGGIAHGRTAPEEGLRLVIEEVFRSAGLSGRSRLRLGYSHDAHRLVAFQDDYDDIRRYERRNDCVDRRRPQVDAAVLVAAREWMAKHAS